MRYNPIPALVACWVAGIFLGLALPIDTTVPPYVLPPSPSPVTTDWLAIHQANLVSCEAAIEEQRLACVENPDDLDAWLLWTSSVRSNCNYTRDRIKEHSR